jgi:glycosyltransferase involved in cell wall biosynthesis
LLYGLNLSTSKLNSYNFFQMLAISGEASPTKIYQRLYLIGKYYLHSLMGLGIPLDVVESDARLHLKPIQNKLAYLNEIFNAPNIFAASQYVGSLFNRETLVSFPEKYQPDVMHLTLPLPINHSKLKKVVTVHDIIPLIQPNSTAINLDHYVNQLNTSLKTADMIFSVSRKTKTDLMEYFDIPDKKIHVTYQTSIIPESLKSIDDETLNVFLKQFNLEKNKYFLFYGAVEPKKNLSNLLQAFLISKTDHKLVIVGKDGWLFEEVNRFLDMYENLSNTVNPLAKNSRIIRLPYLPFIGLMYLLKGAKALSFISTYEGFGLPVLEAMQMGCPVITSNQPPLTEIAEDAAHYVDPYSLNDIKNAIERLSSDDALVAILKEKGYTQAEKFSVSHYQEKLKQGYNALFS